MVNLSGIISLKKTDFLYLYFEDLFVCLLLCVCACMGLYAAREFGCPGRSKESVTYSPGTGTGVTGLNSSPL